MAAPMSRRLAIIACCMIFVIFLFNKIIVMHLMDSVSRGKSLRFQLTCFILAFVALIALYVWHNLSGLFDKSPVSGHSFIQTLRDIRLSSQVFVDFSRYSTSGKLWRLFLLFVLLSSMCSYASFSMLVGTEATRLALWFFTAFGLVVQLFVGILIVRFFSLVMSLVTKHRGARYSRLKSAIAVIYAFCIVSVGFYRVMWLPPEIKEVKIPVKNLPQSLDRLSITLIADIHLGPTVGKSTLEKIVHTVNYLNSDLVVIAGDLVDASVSALEDAVEPLSWINSKYGVYFVTGNHEYYTIDAHSWLVKLESLGVNVLHNSHVWLPSSDNKGICLAGVDDPTADSYRFMDHTMDIEKALGECGDDNPVILVAHQPSSAKKALLSGHRVDLALSGHTHGGQMFPLTIGAYLFNPFYAGLYPYGKSSHVYVTMGTVFWGFPVRFGTRSEITQITLVDWTSEDQRDKTIET